MYGSATNRKSYYPGAGQGSARSGLSDANWGAALVGIYQAYTQAAQQAQANDAAVDYLREQVYAAIADIRFAIRHGAISPGQAYSAGMQIINAFRSQIANLPTASRNRGESYVSTMTDYVNLNKSEADWFYGLWNCPDITTQAQIGEPRCVRLSVAAGTVTPGSGSQSPTSGGGAQAPPGTTGSTFPPGAATGSIFDLLGSIDLGGISIPILPVVAIGGILFFALRK